MTTLKTVRHIASATAVVVLLATGAAQQPQTLTFVVTSDAHYGIARAAFRGATNVGAHVVNRALVEQIGRIPDPLDFVVETGDVANREEAGIPPAAQSWKLFETDYLQTLHVPVFVVPGNHEASNAVGFHQPMTPKIDASAMVGIYNLMMRPATPLTTTTYDYARDKVLSSRDIDGVHFVFVQVWPDSVARAWLDKDLARVSATTPVILFTHDQPDVEAKHFRNPNPPHDVNPRDRFENLLADTLEDGRTIDTPTVSAQRALASFVRRHPNIVAY
ncbi:MAG TPA: metallophosphoesterase, partial [Vicinamibacterales bacterium]|nr:metallophosphoesterase [Vicinamibacterales bacterium]